MNFLTVIRKELLEQWRTYKLLIVAAVLVVFGLISPLLAKLTPELLKAVPNMPPELALAIPASTLESRIKTLKINKHMFRGTA